MAMDSQFGNISPPNFSTALDFPPAFSTPQMSISIDGRFEGFLVAKNSPRTPSLSRHGQVKRIDVLSDDILLEIFAFYVDMSPFRGSKRRIETWQSLVHVCRRWRNLVFQSPRRLNLQLFCTPETPVKDTLDVWPALPLIVQGRMGLSDTDNVIAALGQSNRLCHVDLGLTSSRSENFLAMMQVPFPELTVLRLFSDDEGMSVVPFPDSFLGGSAPSLRHISLEGILFTGLPNLLLSAVHLVDLRLTNIPHSGYISPEAIAALISVLSSLRAFSLGFQSPQSRPDQDSRSLLPLQRFILPPFYEFRFKGVTEYLEELVTRIDTPQLNILDTIFFNK